MPPINRKAMSDDLKETCISERKKQLTANPFPTNETEYFGSEWSGWIDRIEDGAKAAEIALSVLPPIPEGCPLDLYAEEFGRELEVSQIMYAALTVGIWSKIETFLGRCIRAWNYDTSLPIKYEHYNISDFVKSFKNVLGIELDTLSKYKYANASRILANSFKHNDGYYKPDSFHLNANLALEWEIEKDRKVDYGKLPYVELLLDCGEFCGELSSMVRSKLTT